jgi:hypothetical protein
MDLQATSVMIDGIVKGVTILLMIIAFSMAITKKNTPAFIVVIFGNIGVYFFTKSPLLCMIVSIACIIWVGVSKTHESSKEEKQASKSQKAKESSAPKKSKIGNIIGLILGIGFVMGPLIGYLRQEASLKDPTTQGILILFAVIGAFMIINNIFKLIEGGEPVQVQAASKKKVKDEDEEDEEESEDEEDEDEEEDEENEEEDEEESEKEKKKKEMIRCRFCKKLYSAEYNGCPYCKRK